MTEINNEENVGEVQYVCPECQTGVMHMRYLTYFTWLNEELITVPNFPAWVCDMCGRRDYDYRAISWLNTLLHPETGRKTHTHRKLPTSIGDSGRQKKPLYPN
jgi:YgiT-type zinc finger domain-containing protein